MYSSLYIESVMGFKNKNNSFLVSSLLKNSKQDSFKFFINYLMQLKKYKLLNDRAIAL